MTTSPSDSRCEIGCSCAARPVRAHARRLCVVRDTLAQPQPLGMHVSVDRGREVGTLTHGSHFLSRRFCAATTSPAPAHHCTLISFALCSQAQDAAGAVQQKAGETASERTSRPLLHYKLSLSLSDQSLCLFDLGLRHQSLVHATIYRNFLA